MQTFQVAALALPVADGIINELKRADAAKVRDRKHRHEYGLQTDVLALVGQQVHLQKFFVRFFWTSIRFGIGIEVLMREKSTRLGAKPL